MLKHSLPDSEKYIKRRFIVHDLKDNYLKVNKLNWTDYKLRLQIVWAIFFCHVYNLYVQIRMKFYPEYERILYYNSVDRSSL